MAFDMYLNNKHEKIDHYEEGIFEIINEDDDYPTLNWIWEKLYDGPSISPSQSNLLVHEMLKLLPKLPNENKNIIIRNLVIRVLPFFSEAYTSNSFIKTDSD
jgi:hypothetical protein